MLRADLKKALLGSVTDPAVRFDAPNKERSIGRLILNGVELKYNDLVVVVEQGKLDEACALIKAMTQKERHRMRNSAYQSLAVNYPDIISGKFDKAQADSFYADMCLRYAFKKLMPDTPPRPRRN